MRPQNGLESDFYLSKRYPNLDHSGRESLFVGPSSVKEAGDGLFTSQSIDEGDIICYYVGSQLSFLDFIKNKDHTYMMGGFGLNVHIDARPHLGVLARYINDNFDGSKINSRFQKFKNLKYARVIATRKIEANEEIFASYGRLYWEGKKSTSPPTEENSDFIAND